MINQKILQVTEEYQHIIWDWNGTLIDDVDVAVEAVNVLLTENQIPLLTAATYREVFGFPIRDYYQKIGFNFQKVPFEILCARFVEEYNVKRASFAKLFDGVPEMLQLLKQTKTQSILSAAEQSHLEEMTEYFQIHDFFHHRFGIDNHFAASKLDRGRELIQRSGIAKEETILIGDTDHDYEVAEELDIACLIIADGHQSTERLSIFTDNIVHGRRRF